MPQTEAPSSMAAMTPQADPSSKSPIKPLRAFNEPGGKLAASPDQATHEVTAQKSATRLKGQI